MNASEKTFIISDTHFDHQKIIRYCNRDFKNIDDMNTFLLDSWNNTITNSDTVYFLGDLRYGRDSHSMQYWLDKLNGNIIFISGSHDNQVVDGLEQLHALTLQYLDIPFLLIHNPADIPEDWKEWVIHGHVHNNDLEYFPFVNGDFKTINVSVELIGYSPINIERLFELDFQNIKYMRDINTSPIYY
jgi:calcineurin-like phosphoesterase family protein